MSEVKRDAAIKLFGMTISLPCSEKDESLSENIHSSFESSNSHDSKDESIHDYDSTNPSEDKSSEEEPTSSETNGGDSKKDESGALKKPDKIIPCPRCASMDTKFCYFNNYNVNQPRHFCKKCQRYWTSGGTMRNVPVGSGRRKTKNALLPTYPNMIISNSDILDSSNGNFLISPRGFPVSFYPATLYWGSSALHNTDDPPQLRVPVLGKHSRDGKENHNGILVPKTLRIHDPIEAAKSSIWSTLGIKNGNNGMFEAFESKGDRHTSVGEREMMMQANPAAFSRSLNFHERV